MLKLSKMTDYAAVVMARIAREPDSAHAAIDLAESVQLPHPTVSKTLKALVRAGLLESRRGALGGYRLARPASQITASDIISAIEGPVAVTECSHADGDCELVNTCGVADNWQRVSYAISELLGSVTLAHLASSAPLRMPVQLPIQAISLYGDDEPPPRATAANGTGKR
ncbi:SUF system Fe-S cluster assembly regulator [Cobetia sp.]|jgi:FeS assembly SUF system regulator|uniref:SUF system Fe-S cluster assembly regulator n=1 Tax=Cobetia sp. TaxID=1873876 RepID=UPI000C3DF029|nr:SUF system Fe-S cluster assembly regulator [Cobetia sp.]MBF07290.1 SUF system Fe-S cluster assembly regulator [Cobetia sp.]MBF08610.1 SUF system Fe-S cluster assembly regulator [Cobetia sp.]HBJ28003.1 SUF system Fe-S cluster assembly regulator [Cobetia sp.]|tara:strand:+ start:35681 stop:36187 length:507 start_codon:yes stop_codon:yes gene_type:complete